MPKPSKAKLKTVTPIWRQVDRADHIYRVAAEIMCQRGYEATSMNEIAEAVGLTKAGLYHYIRGKEDLLFQIMTYAMDMVDEDVIGPAQQVVDAEERLRTIVGRHAKRIFEVGGAVTILLDEMSSLTPAHRRRVKARKRAYFDLVRETLERLASEGKLRDVEPTVATFCLFGMIVWISRWYRRAGRLTPAQAGRDFVEIATGAVLKGEGGASTRILRAALPHAAASRPVTQG
jgi:TetR/AcrR family transcriptional regulator, cholesterol catabolism regulator